MAIEMLAPRGLSVRDIEETFKDKNGHLLLPRTAVSQLGERLREDYQTCAQRDLSEYEVSYLFIEGIAERCDRAPSASRFWPGLYGRGSSGFVDGNAERAFFDEEV